MNSDTRNGVPYDPLGRNFATPGKPARSYLIASAPRSGSTLLARALWETGQAGAPHEYLNKIFLKGWFKKWGELPVPEYLQRHTEINTSPNGVFAMKAHYHQLDAAVLRDGLELGDFLPNLTYIRINRGDAIRQAISYSRALQSDNWTIEEKEVRGPTYSVVEIHNRLKELAENERQWDDYFRERNIDPLVVSYEEMESNYQATMRRVLKYLDLEEAVDRIAAPPMGKQRDSITEDWYRRFIDDIGPSRLAWLASKLRVRLRNRFK